MPERRRNMMRMMDEMKVADAKLDALVQAMNAATGAEKTDAIAALLNALVEQHRAMHGSMTTMMSMMKMNMMDMTSMKDRMGMPSGTVTGKPTT